MVGLYMFILLRRVRTRLKRLMCVRCFWKQWQCSVSCNICKLGVFISLLTCVDVVIDWNLGKTFVHICGPEIYCVWFGCIGVIRRDSKFDKNCCRVLRGIESATSNEQVAIIWHLFACIYFFLAWAAWISSQICGQGHQYSFGSGVMLFCVNRH